VRTPIATAWRKIVSADADAPLVFEWIGLVKFLPLILCGGFFAFSVLWLAVGPLDWHIKNPWLLYSFLIACILALTSGYLYGIRRAERTRPAVRRLTIAPNRLMICCGLVALVLYFPTVHATTGVWFPDVYGGLTHAGNAYRVTKALNASGSPVIFYVQFLLSPLLILIAPVTYFLWPRLSWVARALGLASVVGTAALSVSQGINKGMADLTAYTCLFLALVAASSLRKGSRRRLLGAIIGVGLVGALFLSYYAVNIQSRMAVDAQNAAISANKDSSDASGAPSDQTPNPLPPVSQEKVTKQLQAEVGLGGVATPRKGHFIYSLPGNLQASTLVLSSYITHPYKGLSMALAEPWTPTYGLGFSEFFRHNVTKVIGGSGLETSVEAETYAGKLTAAGWPVGQVWATFFIEPASDISFPGVILLMAAIGFFFARSWRDTVTKGNPYAAAVFYALCALVFYLPANNQLFQGGETAIGFTVLFIVWLISRLRRHRTAKGDGSSAPRFEVSSVAPLQHPEPSRNSLV
jgi:hypothetical protein